MCVSLLLMLGTHGWLPRLDPTLIWIALVAEGASLMFFCTLVDIATRVRKRPPWWLAILLVGAVLLVYPELIHVLRLAWSEGLWVFLPLAWSLVERVRELWTLPLAADDEKIRRRTLTFDRLWTGFVLGMIAAVCCLGLAWLSEEGSLVLHRPIVPVSIGLLFYGIAAFNVWRVYQSAFAKRPSSLLPWLDRGEGTHLSPL